MKNLAGKITNLKLEISSKSTDTEKHLINQYWELNEKFVFLNSFKTLQTDYKLRKAEISKIINLHSHISFYGYCTSCKTYEHQEVRSRGSFKDRINLIKNINNKFVCDYCQVEQQEKRNEEEEVRVQKESEYQAIVQVKAIEDKAWEELSSFDQGVLKSCIAFNDFSNLKRYYKEKLAEKNYPNLFTSMKALGEKSLLKLTFTDFYNIIIGDYEFHPILKDISIEQKTEVKPTSKPPKNEVFYNREIEELKFKLTNYNNSKHPDKPRYSGILEFKEEITFKPGIDYTFGMWERVNNDLYLTIIPTSKIGSYPLQRRISNEPIHIQNAINDYFDKVYNGFNS